MLRNSLASPISFLLLFPRQITAHECFVDNKFSLVFFFCEPFILLDYYWDDIHFLQMNHDEAGCGAGTHRINGKLILRFRKHCNSENSKKYFLKKSLFLLNKINKAQTYRISFWSHSIVSKGIVRWSLPANIASLKFTNFPLILSNFRTCWMMWPYFDLTNVSTLWHPNSDSR